MSYSQETFESYFSKMDNFQKIAAKNGFALKELLIKKVGLDEELADALIKEWENKKSSSPGQAGAGSPLHKNCLNRICATWALFKNWPTFRAFRCGIGLLRCAALIRKRQTRLSKHGGRRRLKKAPLCWISPVNHEIKPGEEKPGQGQHRRHRCKGSGQKKGS